MAPPTKSFWQLSPLDQMAVQYTAYRVIDFVDSLVGARKPETRYHVLTQVQEGLRELLEKATAELDTTEEDLTEEDPEVSA